jgi:hypothetical protein
MPSDGNKNSRKILLNFDPHEKYVLKKWDIEEKVSIEQ